MIKNIIIISLLLVIVLGWSADDFLNYVSIALDKMKEVVYYIQNEVK
jgi:type III secretory pathway component EscS